MITIYGAYRSRATRPMWLLEEMQVAWQHVPVVPAFTLAHPKSTSAPLNTQSPEYISLSPSGLIPTMVDDGFVLHESLAINLYLARKYGGALAPSDLHEESKILEWSLFAATSIEPAALEILYASTPTHPRHRRGAVGVEIEAAHRLDRPLSVLEDHLSVNSNLIDNRFTVADINVAEIVRFAQSYGPLFDHRPALKNWLAACQSRPSFRTIWQRRSLEVG